MKDNPLTQEPTEQEWLSAEQDGKGIELLIRDLQRRIRTKHDELQALQRSYALWTGRPYFWGKDS